MLRNQFWFRAKTWRWWFNILFSLGLQCKRFSLFHIQNTSIFVQEISSSDSFCLLNYLPDSFLMRCFARVSYRSVHRRVFAATRRVVARAQLAGASVTSKSHRQRSWWKSWAVAAVRLLQDGVGCRRLAVMWSVFDTYSGGPPLHSLIPWVWLPR